VVGGSSATNKLIPFMFIRSQDATPVGGIPPAFVADELKYDTSIGNSGGAESAPASAWVSPGQAGHARKK
jgi:hypothetical protein